MAVIDIHARASKTAKAMRPYLAIRLTEERIQQLYTHIVHWSPIYNAKYADCVGKNKRRLPMHTESHSHKPKRAQFAQ